MNEFSSESLLLMGKVSRPLGLGGHLIIHSYARSAESFLEAGVIRFKLCSGETRRHEVLSVKSYKKLLLFKLRGVDTREEAEEYQGAEVFVEKGALSRDPDEYFWFQLIGLRVFVDDSGQYVGTVENILNTGSHDIYVVRKGRSEYLVPAIEDVVREIDLEKGRMIINPLEGMLDPDEI